MKLVLNQKWNCIEKTHAKEEDDKKGTDFWLVTVQPTILSGAEKLS